jgi:FMN-dependent oxidoreductase (nitrilotriacetate monooxygenase family)
MAPKRFHLGWFLTFRTPVWRDPLAGDVGREWPNGQFHIEMARALENACFDYMMIEDSSKVPDAYGGTFEMDLKHGRFAPKHDPAALVPLLAAATEYIGLICTMSTSFYPPYILARLTNTLDHLCEGRFGWNMVTSSGDRAAQNFGLDELYDHDLRYQMANEFTELVHALWDSWDPDAVVMDRESGTWANPAKVRPIHFKGRFFASRGPLNTLPSPQLHPVLCQAGASPAGKDFAARWADTIIGQGKDVAAEKAFRTELRERIAGHGRDPDRCKIMFGIHPVIGRTPDEAKRKAETELNPDDYDIEEALDILSAHSEVDFSQFDLDGPLPEITTNGHRSTMEALRGTGETVRDVARAWWRESVDESLVGTPAQIADRLQERMEEIGGDGFLIMQRSLTRDYINDIAYGLAPELKRRGLIRDRYSHKLLRDNLLEY